MLEGYGLVHPDKVKIGAKIQINGPFEFVQKVLWKIEFLSENIQNNAEIKALKKQILEYCNEDEE